MNLIKDIIKEAFWLKAYKEDLAPQAIILMGLPASGKSTFINTELSKYFSSIPHVKSFKVLNSDSQLKKVQFDRSKIDYEIFKKLDEKSYNTQLKSMSYESNDGKRIDFKLSFSEFQKLKNHKEYFQKTFKNYYATYFGERAKAQKDTQELTDKKISGTDVVIVDTTGQNAQKYLNLFKKTKDFGYTNSVVFLDIPVEYSIGRDKYRGATEGRAVGEEVIKSIAEKLPSSYKTLKGSDLVDRSLKFKWQGELVKGKYNLIEDKKKYPYKTSG